MPLAADHEINGQTQFANRIHVGLDAVPRIIWRNGIEFRGARDPCVGHRRFRLRGGNVFVALSARKADGHQR